MTFRITVRTIARDEPIFFRGVDRYDVIDGFVTFQDPKYPDRTKRFSTSNCEIEDEV